MSEVDKNVSTTTGTTLRAKIPTGDITGFHRAIAQWGPFESGAIQVETRTMGEMSEITLHSPKQLGFLADFAIDAGVLKRWRECFSKTKNAARK